MSKNIDYSKMLVQPHVFEYKTWQGYVPGNVTKRVFKTPQGVRLSAATTPVDMIVPVETIGSVENENSNNS